jgi:molybdopterin-guanine dinucleotide biosynthesis protein
MVRSASRGRIYSRMPKIVAIAGIASNVGKTTLVCALLDRLQGWEAIKVTKGHYRSCGKDPHACCVSHLLSDRPLVMSERRATDVPGKDTGRYWSSGAANVHWVVATKQGVDDGIREALGRVSADAPGVIVEGTGLLRSLAVDLSVMVAPNEPRELKASAAGVISAVDYVYVSGGRGGESAATSMLERMLEARGVRCALPPILYESDFASLVAKVQALAAGEPEHATP